ncbi:MAG: gamma-glutamyl-gamma-aminobutyrate hydrolase family protein [Rhodobacterales bacterium]|nr:gamma-glutamyl-gamma-aminobutyrate hydrolase family protein [Rhodobacterales bacterium]
MSFASGNVFGMSMVVLVTADRRTPTGNHDGPRVRPRRPHTILIEPYSDAVRAVGAIPLLLPPGETQVADVLARVDAVVLTGGHFDIHPSLYGESVTGRLDRVEPGRTSAELTLARLCLDQDIPLLGICGGMQAMAVAAGGTLIQDLPPADGVRLAHEQLNDPAEFGHSVRVEAPAQRWLGASVQANSTHHQAVANPGSLVACGWAEDGVIEVIASSTARFAVGVQWHPELLGQLELYRALVAAVAG